jgi:phage antirepressor YoqD-like protein
MLFCSAAPGYPAVQEMKEKESKKGTKGKKGTKVAHQKPKVQFFELRLNIHKKI